MEEITDKLKKIDEEVERLKKRKSTVIDKEYNTLISDINTIFEIVKGEVVVKWGYKKLANFLKDLESLVNKYQKKIKVEPEEKKEEFTYKEYVTLRDQEKSHDEVCKIAEVYGIDRIKLRPFAVNYSKRKKRLEEKVEILEKPVEREKKEKFDIKEFYEQKGFKLSETDGGYVGILYDRMVKSEGTTLSNLADVFNEIDPIKYKKERIGKHTLPNSLIYSNLHRLIKRGIVHKEGYKGNYLLSDIQMIKDGKFDKNNYMSLVHLNGVDKNILKYIFKDFNNKSLRRIAVAAANTWRSIPKKVEETGEPFEISNGIKIRYIDVRGQPHLTPEEALKATQSYINDK